MEFSLKNTTLFLAILLVGLSAGLFYAWAVSVIPGTKRIPDKSYLEAMQSINRAILNPAFFLIFFGSLLLMISSTYLQFKADAGLAFWLLLSATITYLIGTLGVTMFGNVPMNDALDVIRLSELDMEQLSQTRKSYEGKWNQFHMIRTAFSVLAFAASLLAAFFNESVSST